MHHPVIEPTLTDRDMAPGKHHRAAALTIALTIAAASAAAQQTPQPAAPAPVITVGAIAPDFALPGATRYGLLANPVRLSDFRGQTVVIAFFFKARTKG
jgi:peroxiredoxin Q/BCP